MRKCLNAALIGAALLAGCATDSPLVRHEKPVVKKALEALLAEADVAAAAGQHDKANAILKAAAADHPAEKAPWLNLAQLKFDRGTYSEAILQAQEALVRDPSDRQAHSIIAVSALRLSTRSLAELSQQSKLGGSVRSEAQELARMLRSTLGEDVLVPPSGAQRAGRRLERAVKALPPVRQLPSPSTGADPFGALK